MNTYPKTVLVVDDSHTDQLFLEALLDSQNIASLIASNGEEALACLSNRKVDIVLLDCVMPEMDGYETCKHIRNLPSSTLNNHVPIIAVTGSEEVTKNQCLNAGMSDFIEKPIQTSRLFEKLKIWEAENQRFDNDRFLNQVGHQEQTGNIRPPNLQYNYRQRLDYQRLLESVKNKRTARNLLEHLKNEINTFMPTIKEPNNEPLPIGIENIQKTATTMFAYEIADYAAQLRDNFKHQRTDKLKQNKAQLYMSCNQTLIQIDKHL